LKVLRIAISQQSPRNHSTGGPGGSRSTDLFGEGEKEGTTQPGPELEQKTVHIKEGDTGYSYQNLFGDYLKGANKIYVTDPYVRMDYQIRNFMSFAGILDTRTEILLYT